MERNLCQINFRNKMVMDRITDLDLVHTMEVLEQLVKIVEEEPMFEAGIQSKNRDKIRHLMGCQELIGEILAN
tara:strand:- start:773 stop:991 length:219 start_codon:yes stop_codon:yes gene_type:complete